MATWMPILKAALPYVSSIVAAALPAFTSRKGSDVSNDLVTQQISELQTAVTNNAEAVKGLAAQLEKTLGALETGEAETAQRLDHQFASVNESLARCESMVTLAQAQASRLDGITAVLERRTEEIELQFKRQQTSVRSRELAISAIALCALLLAIVALLH